MAHGVLLAVTTGALTGAALVGCAPETEGDRSASAPRTPSSASTGTTSSPVATAPTAGPSTAAERTVLGLGTRARRIRLAIPALGVERNVVAYRGTADDRPGTEIQDRGLLATPRGPGGGVGPGQTGNFVVTGHRTTGRPPFRDLPDLRRGAHVLVRAGGRVYDYRVVRTLRVSFRDRASRLSQSAPVPGRSGEVAADAWITLSTCATPEDHAAGNYWSDALGNPEHRIDKIGRLVAVRAAP